MKIFAPEIGDRRTKTKFLFFPKEINKEIRWLERATWVEEWKKHRNSNSLPEITKWSAVKWKNESENRNNSRLGEFIFDRQAEIFAVAIVLGVASFPIAFIGILYVAILFGA